MSPMSAHSPITIASHDPEIMTLQSLVFGLHHFDSRDLSMRHFRLIVAVELCKRVFKVNGTKAQIALLARIKESELEPEFSQLLEKKYLHEIVPTYGSGPFTYKLGSVGGTLVKHLLKDDIHAPKIKSPAKAKRLRARRSERTKGDPKGKGDSQAKS